MQLFCAVVAFAAIFIGLPSGCAIAAGARNSVVVTLSAAADKLVAHYALAEPVDLFEWEEGAAEIRSRTWQPTTTDIHIEGSQVSRTDHAPLSRFDVQIAADDMQVDGVYPIASRVGDAGWLVHVPHLRARTGTLDTKLELKLPLAFVCAPCAGSTTAGTQSGVFSAPNDAAVFIGPANEIQQQSSPAWTLIGASHVPGWIAPVIQQAANQALTTFSARLGPPLVAAPIVVLVYDARPARTDYHGDTTAHGVIALRWHGPAWQDNSGLLPDQVRVSIAHELFHLWNAETFHQPAGHSASWLHEGSAQYAAQLVDRQMSKASSALRLAAMSQRLNTCRLKLDLEPLGDSGFDNGSASYECGAVIQWLADLDSRWTSGEQRDFFSMWRSIFDEAARNGNQYTAEDFLRIAFTPNDPSRARRSALAILNERGAQRWAGLAQSLRSLGLKVTAAASDPSLRDRLLLHVLSQSCGAGYYYSLKDARVQIKTSGGCGPFADRSEVTAVEGHDLFTDARAAFDAVNLNCGKNRPVTFTSSDSAQKITAPCKAPLPPARETYTVTEP